MEAGPFDDQRTVFRPGGNRAISDICDGINPTIRFLDAKSGQIGSPIEGNTDVVVCIFPPFDGEQDATDYITLRTWDAERDECSSEPFCGSGRSFSKEDTGGWTTCSVLADVNLITCVGICSRSEICRKLCSKETRVFFGKHVLSWTADRLFLGKFGRTVMTTHCRAPGHNSNLCGGDWSREYSKASSADGS